MTTTTGSAGRLARLATMAGVVAAASVACGSPPRVPGEGQTSSGHAVIVTSSACPDSVPAVPGRTVDRYPGWVPSGPVGFDGSDRLVPPEAPTAAVLCRYNTKQNAEIVPSGARDSLDGHVSLTGDLKPLADELTWTPRPPDGMIGPQACTAMGGPMRAYLLGLSYSDGRMVWVHGVHEPNGCTIGTNGRFVADVDLGSRLADAYQAKSWRPLLAADQPLSCAHGGRQPFRGRLGDDAQLVPDGAQDVTVCSSTGARRLSEEQARTVLDALRATATEPFPGSFSCSSHQDEHRLLIRHPHGPGVSLYVNPACNLGVTGRRLAAVDQERATFLALGEATEAVGVAGPGTRWVQVLAGRGSPCPVW